MTFADTMILTGSLLILGLAGYWMRRAAKAERRVKKAEARASSCLSQLLFRKQIAHLAKKNADEHRSRLSRIIALETPNMAHVGKKAVAIAKGLK